MFIGEKIRELRIRNQLSQESIAQLLDAVSYTHLDVYKRQVRTEDSTLFTFYLISFISSLFVLGYYTKTKNH